MYTDVCTGERKERLLRVCPNGNERVAVPMHQVFDMISDAHNIKTSHAGRDNTYGIIKNDFFNITEDDVATFIKTCPACDRKNVDVKKLPGAKKPIKSDNYRERFEIDLMDKRSDPQKCVMGVTRRWILTCKDHFTGFCFFDALPRKRPKYVADACHRYFSLIGYPKIFHTDNGTEFTAREIVDFLKSINPSILSVTGRPRKPSDQGSVENMNKLVKRKLTTLEDDQRLKDSTKEPNWVELLPQVTASINSMGGKDKNNQSPYFTVFGMLYHDGVTGSVADARKCHTIEQRLAMFPDEGLQNVADELCVLRDDGDESDGDSNGPNTSVAWDWEETSDEEEGDEIAESSVGNQPNKKKKAVLTSQSLPKKMNKTKSVPQEPPAKSITTKSAAALQQLPEKELKQSQVLKSHRQKAPRPSLLPHF